MVHPASAQNSRIPRRPNQTAVSAVPLDSIHPSEDLWESPPPGKAWGLRRDWEKCVIIANLKEHRGGQSDLPLLLTHTTVTDERMGGAC